MKEEALIMAVSFTREIFNFFSNFVYKHTE